MGAFRRLDMRIVGVVIVLTLAIPAIVSGTIVFRMRMQNRVPAGTELPAWTVDWSAPSGRQITLSPATALATRLYAQQTADGSEHAPAEIRWLLESTTIAIAIVQLDPASQYQSLVYVAHISKESPWIEDSLDLGKPQPCGKGGSAPQELDFLGSVCSTGLTNTRLVSVLNWNTTDGAEFVAYRVNITELQIPANATEVSVKANDSWLVQQDGGISLEIPLSQQEVLGLSGPPDPQRVEDIATLLLGHLNVFAPVG